VIRKIVVQSQPQRIVQETLFQKIHHEKKACGMPQAVRVPV
jgi:hypothetical protein